LPRRFVTESFFAVSRIFERAQRTGAAALASAGTASRVAPLLLPLVILIATGVRGIDFGVHWDERAFQIGPVKRMVQTGIMLPGYYGYPSLVYLVNSAATLPELPQVLHGADRKGRLIASIDRHEFVLRLRVVHLLLSSLSLVWVYWLVLRWRESVVEAFLAASFLGLSWEVAYHLRWISTDGILMQFGALTILLTLLFLREPRRGHLLHLAAIAAGLGCGTKYPGGLLLVPVVIAAASSARGAGAVLTRVVKVVSVFAAAYLTSTPATLLHPEPFLAALRYEVYHYGTGHAGHTVGRVGEHGMRMLAYFADVVFSAWPALALPVFGLSLIGIYAVAREGKVGVVLLSFPALYAAYFATQRAMVVRNLLVVVPFLAIVAARGATWVWERRRGASLVRPLTVGLLAMVILVNSGWLIWAAETIVDRRTDRFVRETASYLSSVATSPVWVSPRLRIHLARLGWVKPGHVVDDPRGAERLALYASEGMTRWQEWPANRPGLTERWFGPREVNFDIYPNWWGDDRIIVMSRRQALAVDLLPVAPARFADFLPGENVGAIVARTGSADGTSPRHLIHPCALLRRVDIEHAIGPSVDGPWGATASDGRGCEYAGPTRVVSIGLLSVLAFESRRPDAGGVVSVDVGESGYWHPTGPGDVSLFARLDRFAIMVRVAVADDAAPEKIALHLARTAVARLRAS
jgi:4-amino-4-deoxy-L-arabinose transferase-like glycosyltransferase